MAGVESGRPGVTVLLSVVGAYGSGPNCVATLTVTLNRKTATSRSADLNQHWEVSSSSAVNMKFSCLQIYHLKTSPSVLMWRLQLLITPSWLAFPLSLSSGIVHHGCWYMDSRGRLGTLEGRNPDLTDDPLTRENPVSKCGLAAQTESFLFFGVTQGYCISGSNRLSDYQYVRSGLCMDGKGGYSRGYFIMDVYEITSQQNFRDSVVVNDTAITESDVLSTTAQDSSSSSSTGSTSPLETTSGAVILGAQTQHRHLCLLLVILSLCILTALSAWDQWWWWHLIWCKEFYWQC